MQYREYGKTGKKVSLLGFGGMRFRHIDDREANVALMIEAARAGINYFDTAPGYFGTKSEETFGEGFREMRRLGLPFYCATKTFASTEKEIRAQLEASLQRLGLDAVDFYHVWCITSLDEWRARERDGVLKTFLRLKLEGLIRHICVSSHLIGEEIAELLREEVFEGALFGYSAATFPFREAAFEAIRARRLGAVVMNPLGGGVIPDHPARFEFIKNDPAETVVEAALRFLFAHKEISTVLVGFRDREDLRGALAALEGARPLTEATLARIRASIGPAFADLCTGCRYCDECPEGIPIPELMDAYNFRLLYGKDEKVLDRLKWHWNLPPEVAAKCVECRACEDACTQHLAIIERLHAIAAMRPPAQS